MQIYLLSIILFFSFSILFFSKKLYLFSLISMIAMTTYTLIFLNIGDISNSYRSDYITRFIGWSMSTPLLLLMLLSSSKIKPSNHQIISILMLDILMIYSGYYTLIDNENKWIYFSLSSYFFLFLIFSIYQLKPKNLLFIYLFMIWSVYPIIFALYQSNIINRYYYDISILISDFISKLGFGCLFLV